MHTEPAGACAWAHPRWGRAAGNEPGACPCFERLAGMKPAEQVVKERSPRGRSGVGAAPAQGKTKGPVPWQETGPRMSVEGGV